MKENPDRSLEAWSNVILSSGRERRKKEKEKEIIIENKRRIHGKQKI